MRKLHVVNDDEGGKKQAPKKGGRAERRSKRQADEKALRRRVGRRRADIHERRRRREAGKGLFVPFCRRDELPLTSFSRLVQITTSHSLPSGSRSPHSRLERGAEVATFTIPSSFSNAGGSKHKRRFAPLSTHCLSDILHVPDTFAYASLIKQAHRAPYLMSF